jgi:NAD(P)-dependent dehydrogenase (short-subunit alcohol dehydrogenase family)
MSIDLSDGTLMAECAFFHDEAIAARVTAMLPLVCVGECNEVANAVVWPCSPAASFIAGHTLSVDGGYLI